jgi:hypothetical protein
VGECYDAGTRRDSRQGTCAMAERVALHERELKRKLFYPSLGECITAWAAVERTLFNIFHVSLYDYLKKSTKKKAALLFWAMPTFGMRLSYTNMLVEHCLKTGDGSITEAQKRWNQLNKDVVTLASFRNNLAHQPAAEDEIIFASNEGETDVIYWVEEMIVPNKLDQKKKPFTPIVHSDLEAHLIAVAEIKARLSRFSYRLHGLEEAAAETFSEIEQEDE